MVKRKKPIKRKVAATRKPKKRTSSRVEAYTMGEAMSRKGFPW